MIKIPKNYFTNLSTKQYREYLKLLPKLDDKKTQAYTMLGFTLIALSILGVFAIYPTLSTITELKKKLADLQFLNQQLQVKSQNLSALQQKYQSLTGDLPIVLEAMPEKPEAAKLVAQVNALLSESHLKVNSIKTYGVEITPGKKVPLNQASSFVFSLEAEGDYNDMLEFIQRLVAINRLITVEQISINKLNNKNTIILSLNGRQYFKP
jgi:Tfp pilus assembly protein PilO